MRNLNNCPECCVPPGKPHVPGCDVEICSACGETRLTCGCGKAHDPVFARWTGLWPGEAEAAYIGMDLSEFLRSNLKKVFFIKPGV